VILSEYSTFRGIVWSDIQLHEKQYIVLDFELKLKSILPLVGCDSKTYVTIY